MVVFWVGVAVGVSIWVSMILVVDVGMGVGWFFRICGVWSLFDWARHRIPVATCTSHSIHSPSNSIFSFVLCCHVSISSSLQLVSYQIDSS